MLYREIHKHTYGNNKCAEDLASIVNEFNDKRITKMTGTLLHVYNISIDDLLQTTKRTETWITEFHKQHIKLVKSKNLPNKIESRILNLMKGKFKIALATLRNREAKNKWGWQKKY